MPALAELAVGLAVAPACSRMFCSA